MTTAVSVSGLSKRYRLGGGAGYRRLSESLSGLTRRARPAPDPDLWALRDVSFEVTDGEVLGIIGRNGAGKSTLLKILSRITEPTAGRAVLHGRVGSLLEVGTGFHPELTGRENVYLNGAVLGMRRKDIERRFDGIVEFAEVERFLDTPVKRYSSGMYVRLAFAVAAHLEPEILVIDEVLAVGDASFQKKCLGKMGDVARSGRTVLFVSHNMAAVKSLCSRAMLLEAGEVAVDGTVEAAVDAYMSMGLSMAEIDLAARLDRQGSGRVRVTSLRLEANGRAAPSLSLGRPGALVIEYVAEAQGMLLQASIGLFSLAGEGAAHLSSETTGAALTSVEGAGELRCELDHVPFLPGTYLVNIYVTAGGEIADWVLDAATISVESGDFYGSGKIPPPGYGSVAVPHSWNTPV